MILTDTDARLAGGAFAPAGTTLWGGDGWVVEGVSHDYADLEWAYSLSQYHHGEVFAAAVYAHLLEQPTLVPALRELAESVHQDETRHVEAVRRYLTCRLPAGLQPCLFPHDSAFAHVCARALRSPDVALKLATLHLVVEPFGVASMTSSLRHVQDPECAAMLRSVLADEAHHMRLAEVHLSGLAPERLAKIARWLTLVVAAMSHSAIPRQVYARVLPSHAAALAARAPSSASFTQQGRRVAAALMRACRATPLHAAGDALGRALTSAYAPDSIDCFSED